jgi:hypothetical protein
MIIYEQGATTVVPTDVTGEAGTTGELLLNITQLDHPPTPRRSTTTARSRR